MIRQIKYKWEQSRLCIECGLRDSGYFITKHTICFGNKRECHGQLLKPRTKEHTLLYFFSIHTLLSWNWKSNLMMRIYNSKENDSLLLIWLWTYLSGSLIHSLLSSSGSRALSLFLLNSYFFYFNSWDLPILWGWILLFLTLQHICFHFLPALGHRTCCFSVYRLSPVFFLVHCPPIPS